LYLKDEEYDCISTDPCTPGSFEETPNLDFLNRFYMKILPIWIPKRRKMYEKLYFLKKAHFQCGIFWEGFSFAHPERNKGKVELDC